MSIPDRRLSYSAQRSAFSVQRFLARRETGVAIILFLTIAIVSFINPAFLAVNNIRDILVNVAPAIIVGCAMTFVIVTGEIDISVGSLLGLLAAVLGVLSTDFRGHLPWSVTSSVIATLLLGAAVGFVNGFLIAYLRVPSIITTLGMLTLLRGITKILMHGEWITNLPQSLRMFGTGAIVGIPISLWFAAGVFASCALLTYFTPLGRRIYAVGSNPSAAPLAGLSPARIKLFVFTLTGLLTAVASLFVSTKLSTIESDIGTGFELVVVTAVVVGGTSISGGKGTLLGTLLGTILLGLVGTALIFLKLGTSASYWERAIQGAFILIAVLVDHFARKDRHA
jgi:rhamnose transport system permease protein